MHDAVEDGVGQCWVVEVGVPGLDRQLAGDQGRTRADAVVQQFEQVVALGRADARDREVVDDPTPYRRQFARLEVVCPGLSRDRPRKIQIKPDGTSQGGSMCAGSPHPAGATAQHCKTAFARPMLIALRDDQGTA